MVSLYLYILLALTDYNPSFNDELGIALLVVVLTSFFVNLIKLVYMTGVLAWRKIVPIVKHKYKKFKTILAKKRTVAIKSVDHFIP